MRVYNFLPHLIKALGEWKTIPAENEFALFMSPLEKWLRPMLDDFGSRFHQGLYSVIEGLNWDAYREEALKLDPVAAEAKVNKHLSAVEKLLGLKLEGEVILFGAFTAMDGYARFDQGTHRVYLGVDESHGRGQYLDILITHELTHVAREPLPEIWAGFGLTPKMSHDQFVDHLPVIEHLMGEGFSCVVSEILCPNDDVWNYCYQTEDSLAQVLKHGPAIDRVVHSEIKKPNGDYSRLYNPSLYIPEVPRYAHYVWAWQWAKHVLATKCHGDPKKLLRMCSNDLIEDALKFKLPRFLKYAK